MFDISPVQIVIVLAIALLIFGPKRLPELGRNLGSGLRDFKNGISGETPEMPMTHAVATEPVVTAEQLLKDAAQAAPVDADDIRQQTAEPAVTAEQLLKDAAQAAPVGADDIHRDSVAA